MPELLCARPHEKNVDFATARFRVCKGSGIDIGTVEGVRHLEMGDEVPEGALNEQALRQLYERPVHAIETLEYAAGSSYLCEARAQREVIPLNSECQSEPGESTLSEIPDPLKDLDFLNRKQIADLCYQRGLKTDGTKQQLRSRLATILGRSMGGSKRSVGT
jgi:hypothetical protein